MTGWAMALKALTLMEGIRIDEAADVVMALASSVGGTHGSHCGCKVGSED